MYKVRVKGEGVKLVNNWYYEKEEVIISKEEYEKNKEYVEVIEETEGVDLTKKQENSNNGGANTIETQKNNKEDKELEALREKAKDLGIRGANKMGKENLIAKIEEAEKADNSNNNEDEGQDNTGEPQE